MRLGIIGYGGRIKDIAQKMEKLDYNCKIVAITDIRNDEIRRELSTEGVNREIAFYEDANDMLSNSEIDGVCIGTRCSLHAKMAIKVIPRGIPLWLEKPVATNMNDLRMLYNTYNQHSQAHGKVVVSFPLRVTPLLQLVKEIIDSGKIGTVEHVQAVNNVPYGGVYFHDWYRDENETGGLFLQKATHDLDYINYVLGSKPVRICAMVSKQIFKGDRPAGLVCRDCGEQETCPESPENQLNALNDITGDFCSFAEDTGNEDSGSTLIEYETGMHVVYSQNFFARKGAAARGAKFFGYKGTVEFDWCTDEVKVHMHNIPRVESYKLGVSRASHGGGDEVLMKNFLDMMKGKGVPSVAPMEAGLLSALMCLKARESAKTKTFQDVVWE